MGFPDSVSLLVPYLFKVFFFSFSAIIILSLLLIKVPGENCEEIENLTVSTFESTEPGLFPDMENVKFMKNLAKQR